MTKEQQKAVSRGNFRARKREIQRILSRLEDLNPLKHPNRWANLRDRYVIASNHFISDYNKVMNSQGDIV